jgi:UDP-glucose 4-epimerase
MKVFITGVGGYLGSVLATRLSSMSEIDSITGTFNNSLPRSPLPDKVNLIKMDIRSPEIADAMSGHDFVINSACVVHWPAKMPAAVRDDINFNGTRNVAQAAVRNKVRGFIHASSISAYDYINAQGMENLSEECPLGKGDSPMYYLNSKAIAEKILTEVITPSGIPLTFFRMSFIIGPSNYVTIPAYRQNAVSFRGHNPRAQFVHENDVAQAFAQAIRFNLPGAFNVVSDDLIHQSDFYRIIGVKPITIPLWLARLVTYIRWRYFGSPTHPSWVLSSTIDYSVSNAKLRATGWLPHYNSPEAIRTALQET